MNISRRQFKCRSIPPPTKDALDKRVYLILRDAIFKRNLLPGKKISILSISKELGVSRTPIRIAMQRLATEGLITMVSNQAPRVAKPSSKNAIEIFYMRTLIEPAATALAARYATDSEIIALKALIEKEKLMLTSRNFIDCLKANTNTHKYIAKMGRNKELINTIKHFLDKSTIILFQFDPFYNYSEQEIYADYDEGLSILEAIKTKDENLAAKLMKEHIQRAVKALPLDILDKDIHTLPRLK